MNNAQKIWEQEYSKKQLMTGDKPAKSLLKWIKHLKKSRGPTSTFDGVRVLDLGSGEGKNALYLAGLGAQVDCIEIARNAVATTQNLLVLKGLTDRLEVQQGSIGETYPFPDDIFEAIIDVTSSNSLSEREREIYLAESARVLKPGGQMFVRALCKDGDVNAKNLLKNSPGPEHDTYIIPEWGQTERVFSEKDIRDLYRQYFDILKLEKETHYSTFGDRKYKRNFWVMYLQNTEK